MQSRHTGLLYAEQVRLLYANAPLSYSVTLINGAILAYIQRRYIAASVLIGWYGCLLLVTAIRVAMVARYRSARPEPDRARFWGRAYLAGTAAAGLVWGAAALVLFPAESIPHQLFVAFVLAGMSVGGIAVLAARMEACMAFLFPALLPLIWRLFTLDGEVHAVMGTLVLIFVAGMTMAAWNLHRSIRASLDLRFDNRDLQAQIAQRRRAEEDLFREKDRLRATLASLGEGVAISDASGRIEYVNPEAERLCGRHGPHAVGRPVGELFVGIDKHNRRTTVAMEDSLRSGKRIKKQGALLSACGATHQVEELATPLVGRHGETSGVVSVFRDVSETLETTERLMHAAFHDQLTGLSNRILLRDRINQAIARAQRHRDNLALLFVDLDHFKAINDRMGHAAGDDLLKQVGRRLVDSVRAEDTVARLGGDEFVVLLDGPVDTTQATAIADKILHTLREPFRLGSQFTSITASIGYSLYPRDGHDTDTLLARADAAMYRAKAQGRSRICA